MPISKTYSWQGEEQICLLVGWGWTWFGRSCCPPNASSTTCQITPTWTFKTSPHPPNHISLRSRCNLFFDFKSKINPTQLAKVPTQRHLPLATAVRTVYGTYSSGHRYDTRYSQSLKLGDPKDDRYQEIRGVLCILQKFTTT